jgi:protein-L-isoaspartate(D-aspartate) O-methyltransferase
MDLQEKKTILINSLIEENALKTKAVIEAFKKVRREDFVTEKYKEFAYVDEPLPTIDGQTISQPYTVAVMTEALHPKAGQKILEIGAGSGYQAAILAELVGKKGKIVSVERVKELADFAKQNLKKAGYKNVLVVEGDGTLGYSEKAPYDRIIVTASSPDVPKPLIEQMKAGGMMIIPVGNELYLLEKTKEKSMKKTFLGYYAFVPLIGKYGNKE